MSNKTKVQATLKDNSMSATNTEIKESNGDVVTEADLLEWLSKTGHLKGDEDITSPIFTVEQLCKILQKLDRRKPQRISVMVEVKDGILSHSAATEDIDLYFVNHDALPDQVRSDITTPIDETLVKSVAGFKEHQLKLWNDVLG